MIFNISLFTALFLPLSFYRITGFYPFILQKGDKKFDKKK